MNYIFTLFRFYPRWKETESLHAHSLQFSLDESQWQRDWAILLSLASQPGKKLRITTNVFDHEGRSNSELSCRFILLFSRQC